MELSPEHIELAETVRRFARDEVAPVIADYYEREAFPYPVVAKMAEMGLFGLPFPEEHGGMGGDLLAFCLALEELARVDSSVAITLEAAVGLGAMPIYRFGTDEQRERWLPDLCAGRALGVFGLTEPGGGTDAGATRTTARRDGDDWVIDGTKAFITNSGTDITSFVTVTAITARPDGGRPEISAIVVPAGTAGFTVAPKYSKVGWSASDTHELAFSACRVPAANLLGPEGRGYAQFLEILDEGRVAIAALAVGLAQGCIDECVRYLGERQACRLRRGRRQRPRGGADLRRLRVHERDARRSVRPRRQDPGDRRGHVGGPAHADHPSPRPARPPVGGPGASGRQAALSWAALA